MNQAADSVGLFTKGRVWKLLLLLLAGVFTWFAATAIMIWSFGGKDHAGSSDCIIVLGAAVYGAQPSPVFEERIRHAINLFREGKAPMLIFTGGHGDGSTHSESEVGAAFAAGVGVPVAAILTEDQSQTTLQNLIQAKVLMDGVGLKTAIIVSDPLHLKRASSMAADLGIAAVTSPTPTSRYRSLKAKGAFLFREVFFYNFYLVAGH